MKNDELMLCFPLLTVWFYLEFRGKWPQSWMGGGVMWLQANIIIERGGYIVAKVEFEWTNLKKLRDGIYYYVALDAGWWW